MPGKYRCTKCRTASFDTRKALEMHRTTCRPKAQSGSRTRQNVPRGGVMSDLPPILDMRQVGAWVPRGGAGGSPTLWRDQKGKVEWVGGGGYIPGGASSSGTYEDVDNAAGKGEKPIGRRAPKFKPHQLVKVSPRAVKVLQPGVTAAQGAPTALAAGGTTLGTVISLEYTGPGTPLFYRIRLAGGGEAKLPETDLDKPTAEERAAWEAGRARGRYR